VNMDLLWEGTENSIVSVHEETLQQAGVQSFCAHGHCCVNTQMVTIVGQTKARSFHHA
jgi:hypothetical protein